VATLQETGNTIATAPVLVEFHEKFGLFERRRRAYNVVFQRRGCQDERVAVVLRDWVRTREKAVHIENPLFVYAVFSNCQSKTDSRGSSQPSQPGAYEMRRTAYHSRASNVHDLARARPKGSGQ
jgi:hypothetical protein